MAEQQQTIAALGLGGNIGDPRAAMAQALQQLDRHENCRVEAVSSLYRTPPWGNTDQAEFFNCCALVTTSLSPHSLLNLCLDIEKDMKRIRNERWGPRTIDIDVLTYGDTRLATDALELPHPRMSQRGFVLLPLTDIAAGLIVDGRSVANWLSGVDTTGIVATDINPSWWRSTPDQQHETQPFS